MFEKLKSRKLWVFIVLVILVVCNYRFNLGMPPGDVFYLVILGASYILGQGYVDAKQQPVQNFPSNDVIQSLSNIIQTEVGKLDLNKNIPVERIIDALTPVFREELQKLNTTTPKEFNDAINESQTNDGMVPT